MQGDLPTHARVVVIGAGIAGSSVAYHLTKMDWPDVVLLERQTLASGTSGFAAGLVTQLRASRTLTEISRYGVQLYPQLLEETGHDPGFQQTGSISIASIPERMDEYHRIISMGRAFGVEVHELSPSEIGDLIPIMRTDDLVGGYYVPKDGRTIPDSTAMALAVGATQRGATLVENVRVTGIRHKNGAITGVSTSRGDITCEVVVNCAGMWAREIGLMRGVAIPLHAAEHMHLSTAPFDGVSEDMPSIRDPDGFIYFRRDIENTGGMLMGGFELEAKPWGMGGIPDNLMGMRPNWDRHQVFVDNAIKRIPAMEHAEITRVTVGPESFTPDCHFIAGEAPELKNFFIAAGFNSGGFSYSPGTGRAIAEWIVQGEPTVDLTEVDIRRFHRFENNAKFLHDRTTETLGLAYAMHWPHRQPETARGVRTSPLHDRIAAQGACFQVMAGWERPAWYAPRGVRPENEYSFGRQNWFDHSAEEHRAVREAAGLFDQSSFAKFLIQGKDAESFVQRICANDLSVEPGHVVYTGILNERGGYEADVTVTRIAEDSYMVVTGAGTSTRTLSWISQHIPQDAHLIVTDVSSAYGVLGIMGPRSRELLSALTDADLSNDKFPFMASREISIGYAPVRATRITYVGELGWELYIPTEFTPHVYDAIVGEGSQFGLRHAGYHAMESLRTEKGYRGWGHDLTDLDTPLEAGLGFAVAFDKRVDFIGKEALLRQNDSTLTKRLAVFTLDEAEPLLLGNEPIYRDGVCVGLTTSAAFGHTIGRSVALGYVENEDGVDRSFIESGSYEIELATERHMVKVSLRPPYDPKGLRVRS